MSLKIFLDLSLGSLFHRKNPHARANLFFSELTQRSPLVEVPKSSFTAMKFKIFLDSDSYECLLNHVAPGLSRAAIIEAVLLGNTRVVDCDDVQARELLVCARSHCPGAFDRIAEAFRAAGIKI
jgi:hypothetical protein